LNRSYPTKKHWHLDEEDTQRFDSDLENKRDVSKFEIDHLDVRKVELERSKIEKRI